MPKPSKHMVIMVGTRSLGDTADATIWVLRQIREIFGRTPADGVIVTRGVPGPDVMVEVLARKYRRRWVVFGLDGFRRSSHQPPQRFAESPNSAERDRHLIHAAQRAKADGWLVEVVGLIDGTKERSSEPLSTEGLVDRLERAVGEGASHKRIYYGPEAHKPKAPPAASAAPAPAPRTPNKAPPPRANGAKARAS
ncbi:MAG: hypothetical protein IT477_10670 [Rhodanobacteraceae bacterium]|nr:hypothetical protein [Rhodanobacteraceae bacterium]